MNPIIKPHLTSKTAVAKSPARYSFIVHSECNKIEIGKAIAKRYQVEVDSVNTMRCAGKKVQRVTRRSRVAGQTSSFKKAVVTLKKGFNIDLQQDLPPTS